MTQRKKASDRKAKTETHDPALILLDEEAAMAARFERRMEEKQKQLGITVGRQKSRDRMLSLAATGASSCDNCHTTIFDGAFVFDVVNDAESGVFAAPIACDGSCLDNILRCIREYIAFLERERSFDHAFTSDGA